jgi:hypothetical protein
MSKMDCMSEPVDLLGLYLHLARASRQRMRPHVADRFLIIAGTIAARMSLHDIAAYCRQLVLEHNQNHMIRRWATFDAALGDENFLHFLRRQQRRYPQETAERMLHGLGIDMARERATYFSDAEYAAALLGTTPGAIRAFFDDAGCDD